MQKRDICINYALSQTSYQDLKGYEIIKHDEEGTIFLIMEFSDYILIKLKFFSFTICATSHTCRL